MSPSQSHRPIHQGYPTPTRKPFRFKAALEAAFQKFHYQRKIQSQAQDIRDRRP